MKDDVIQYVPKLKICKYVISIIEKFYSSSNSLNVSSTGFPSESGIFGISSTLVIVVLLPLEVLVPISTSCLSESPFKIGSLADVGPSVSASLKMSN